MVARPVLLAALSLLAQVEAERAAEQGDVDAHVYRLSDEAMLGIGDPDRAWVEMRKWLESRPDASTRDAHTPSA